MLGNGMTLSGIGIVTAFDVRDAGRARERSQAITHQYRRTMADGLRSLGATMDSGRLLVFGVFRPLQRDCGPLDAGGEARSLQRLGTDEQEPGAESRWALDNQDASKRR